MACQPVPAPAQPVPAPSQPGPSVPLSGPAEVRVTGPASRRAAEFSKRLRAEQLAAAQQQAAAAAAAAVRQLGDQEVVVAAQQQAAAAGPQPQVSTEAEYCGQLGAGVSHRISDEDGADGGDSEGSERGWRRSDISPEELFAAELQNGELEEPELGRGLCHQDGLGSGPVEPRPVSVSPISAMISEMAGEGPSPPPPPPPAAVCDPEAVLAVARNLSQLGVQQPVPASGPPVPSYPAQPPTRYGGPAAPGAPPELGMATPYGTAAGQYGAPAPASYSAPVQVPPSGYDAIGVSNYDGGSYGAPPPRGPPVSYGSPSQGPPVSYGSPSQGPPVSYGSPSQGPPVSYGSPPQGPPVSYGSPSQGPPVSYGSPAQGPPVSYGSPLRGRQCRTMRYRASFRRTARQRRRHQCRSAHHLRGRMVRRRRDSQRRSIHHKLHQCHTGRHRRTTRRRALRHRTRHPRCRWGPMVGHRVLRRLTPRLRVRPFLTKR